MSTCEYCDDVAEVSCSDSNCEKEACHEHSFRVARRAYHCHSCYEKDRRIGKIQLWSMYGLLFGIIAVISVLFHVLG